MTNIKKNLIIAIPKGRILKELSAFFKKINFELENEFYDESSRKLIFKTNFKNIQAIKVRSFDVATFVNSGFVDFGICGIDVVKEFDFPNVTTLFDLDVGKCRISIAGRKDNQLSKDFKNNPSNLYGKNIKIASKYINITQKYCQKIGLQPNIIKLNGSIEIAPHLKICDFIIDLVSSGNTLKENNMIEIDVIDNISSYFIANRNSLKTKQVAALIEIFKEPLRK
jgi:ATP phosphoribosyltransferase